MPPGRLRNSPSIFIDMKNLSFTLGPMSFLEYFIHFFFLRSGGPGHFADSRCKDCKRGWDWGSVSRVLA